MKNNRGPDHAPTSAHGDMMPFADPFHLSERSV